MAMANGPKPYPYWIHCSRCYYEHIKKERKSFLLACQHVSCERCLIEQRQSVNGPRIYKCSICQKKARACEINTTMPRHLKELFHPEPYLEGLDIAKILTFQSEHRRLILEHLKREQSRLEAQRLQSAKLKENCQKLYQNIKNLKDERKHLERRVQTIRLQRRQNDENRSSNGCTSSSSSLSNSSSMRLLKTSQEHKGVTVFENPTPHISFDL